jgi:outer membrane phospholipase A
MKKLALIPFLIAPAIAAEAQAPSGRGLQPLIGSVEVSGADTLRAQITLLNSGPAEVAAPEAIEADLIFGSAHLPVTLQREGRGGASIRPGAFAQSYYSARLPSGRDGQTGLLSLTRGGTAGYAFAMPVASGAAGTVQVAEAATETQAATAPASVTAANERAAAGVPQASMAVSADRDRGNAFLGNLSAYTPIYAVYGPGTSSDARIQIGFKFQLFGEGGDVGLGSPAINGLHFGFTQRIFWDLGRKSSPFRNVEYMPELFYLVPARPVTEGIAIGGQIGVRHESNGRAGLDSRSLNTIYVQPAVTTTLGGYTLVVAPRAWLYAGSLEDNPDLKRYRGNTGLLAELGTDDGWRLSTSSRMNFGSGKGSIDAELSYPLSRLIGSDVNLYAFGQAFTGYGENLLDYRRRQTRLRIGFGFVR